MADDGRCAFGMEAANRDEAARALQRARDALVSSDAAECRRWICVSRRLAPVDGVEEVERALVELESHLPFPNSSWFAWIDQLRPQWMAITPAYRKPLRYMMTMIVCLLVFRAAVQLLVRQHPRPAPSWGLPGDVLINTPSFTLYSPVASSIVFSVLLNLGAAMLGRRARRAGAP